MYRIGTSGFQYPHWRHRFYPPSLPTDRWLAYYAQRFATVELNVTFYRLPSATTFAAWRRAVPEGFVFAVKASRYLTHVRRLQEPAPAVELLLQRTAQLGDRLGPVLLQLPPDMPIALDRLHETLAAFPRDVRVAVEPRHRSWFVPELKELLGSRGAALCLADRRGPVGPLWRTTDWTYMRFHGGRATPKPCYGSQALATWTGRVGPLWGPDPDAYVYFNNDHAGCAPRDAARFAVLARRARASTSRTPEPGATRVGETAWRSPCT